MFLPSAFQKLPLLSFLLPSSLHFSWRSSIKLINVLLRPTSSLILPFSTSLLVWEKLTVKDLERIEKVKASFMKSVMGVGMNAPSRMAYVLMGELFFIEEIRLSGMLPTTKPYQDLLGSRIRKREELHMEFYGTWLWLLRTGGRRTKNSDRWSPDLQYMDFTINCARTNLPQSNCRLWVCVMR